MKHTHTKQYMPATELLAKSWELIKAHIRPVVGVYALTSILSLVSVLHGRNFVLEKGQPVNLRLIMESIFGLNLQITIAFLILLMVFQVMQLQLQIAIIRKRSVSAFSLWEATRNQFFPLLVLQLAMGLGILLGFVAFILPSVWVFTRLSMAPFVMADKNVGVLESLRSSFAMTKGQWRPIWTMYGLLFACVLIPSFSVFGIAGQVVSLMATVITALMPALRYKELAAR